MRPLPKQMPTLMPVLKAAVVLYLFLYIYTDELKRNPFVIRKTRLFKYNENFTNKKWKFSEKNADIFHISAQNIDCGYLLELPRRGSSNEYPQSVFLSRNKKNNIYPCKPQFYYFTI